MDTPKRKPGRPPQHIKPRTGAENQRRLRERQATAIQEKLPEEWTDAECLHVLTSKTWRNGAIDQQAWEQLGRLRGFTGGSPLPPSDPKLRNALDRLSKRLGKSRRETLEFLILQADQEEP